MKKHLFVFTTILLLVQGVKSQITFTVLNTSGSNSITCATPTIQLLCITNYTASFVTYTMAGPTGTFIGNNFSATLPGTYTLTAFVTNVVNATQTLAIGINTTAPVSAVTPTTQNITCSFTSVTTISATANPSTNMTHYFITPSGNSLAVQGYSATYTPGMSGTHTHVLVNDFNGCKTSKLVLVNSVAGIPTLSLSCPQNFTLGCGSNSVCSVALGGNTNPPGGPLTFTILSSGSTTNYVTNSQNLYQITSPGTYTAISHSNVSGCEARVPFSISSNTSVPTLTLFTNTSTLTCSNSSSILYGISTTPNTSYAWGIPGSTVSTGGFSIGVGTTGISTNSVVGSFSFQVTNNANACSSETSITIYQNIYPPNVLISNAGSNSVTCTTPSVVLTNQSTTGIPPFTFNNTQSLVTQQWIGPSTPSSSGTPSIIAFSVGVYSLTVLDPNNGCTSAGTYSLREGRDYPIVNNPNSPPPYCLDPPTTSIDISPILSGPVSSYTYAWSSPVSATVSGQNTATLTTNTVGTYTIAVTNTISGCTTLSNLIVTVCTGIHQPNNQKYAQLSVFPNPTSGSFKVLLADASTTQSLQLFDLSGRMVSSYSLLSPETEINLENTENGLYVLVLTTNQNTSTYYKLIIEK